MYKAAVSVTEIQLLNQVNILDYRRFETPVLNTGRL